MAIKIFCNPVYIDGYQGNPSTSFKITVPFRAFSDTGGDSNGPRNFDSEAVIYANIGDNALDVYAALYADILAQCANFGWPTPTKGDIYGYAPTGMFALLPDLPAIA